jgi:hypothetical protein
MNRSARSSILKGIMVIFVSWERAPAGISKDIPVAVRTVPPFRAEMVAADAPGKSLEVFVVTAVPPELPPSPPPLQLKLKDTRPKTKKK